MRISEKDVEHVAKLARLALSDEEKQGMLIDLNTIMDMAAKLNEVDTDGIEPTAHVLPIRNVFREDDVRPSLEKDDVLANAPAVQEGMFRVPRIVGEGS